MSKMLFSISCRRSIGLRHPFTPTSYAVFFKGWLTRTSSSTIEKHLGLLHSF